VPSAAFALRGTKIITRPEREIFERTKKPPFSETGHFTATYLALRGTPGFPPAFRRRNFECDRAALSESGNSHSDLFRIRGHPRIPTRV